VDSPIELLHVFTRRQGLAEREKERFAPAVLDEAAAGDPIATGIVAGHGRVLAGQARSCAAAVDLAEPFSVVLTGGVFQHPSAVLADAIMAGIPGGRPVRVPHAPVIGALLLAFDRAGVEPDLDRIVAGAGA
jgi:N-acetylglucosamine kinase-like BadF-type ATPase